MNRRIPGSLTLVILLAMIAMPVTAEVFFTTSTPEVITTGDPVMISGTGAVNGSVAIWIVGRDHFEVLTGTPDRNGNFSITIKPSATGEFSRGQYAIIYQDPGEGGSLEIEGGTDINGSIVVMNRGKIVSRLGQRDELGTDIHSVADKILKTSTIPGVDDFFHADFFFVAEPKIFFNGMIPASGFRIPDHTTGERIVISGTTNIGTENTLSTEIRTNNGKEVVTLKTIPVTPGYPLNAWIWELEAPGLPPGDYSIQVRWPKSDTISNATFTVNYPPPPISPTGKPTGSPPPHQQNDYTFPVFVASSLIVLAIVLYYAGKD